MPRLDAQRLETWRELRSVVDEVTRRIDADLRAEWAVPLGWFDVLAALRALGGRARPQDVAAIMRIPPSSLSRRIDRIEEEGWVRRHQVAVDGDHRAVEVELTPRGRTLWREMNLTYRRSVQTRFARALDDATIGAVAAAITVILLNADLYRFFAARRGLLFAAKSLLFHWLYFICCGVSVIIGTLRFHLTRSDGPSRPERSDVSEERSTA